MPTVLITGCNRGLGLEFVRQYLALGWSVAALCRRSSPELESLRAEPALEIHLADVTDDTALAAVAAGFGGRCIDVLINNAGIMGESNFGESGMRSQGFGATSREEWLRVFDVNTVSPMRIAEAFIEPVCASERGRIVTLSSEMGSIAGNAHGGWYAYRASKAGVNAVMKSMAIDLADRGVLTLALHPGWVRTGLGGPRAPLDVETSVRGMIGVIERLAPADSGSFVSYEGRVMPY